MANLPNPNEIALPGVDAARPIAGYDVSAFGRGGQAIAAGVEKIGAGITAVGQDITDVQHKVGESQYYDAISKGLAAGTDLKAKIRNTDYKTMEDTWDKESGPLIEKAVSGIDSPVFRQKAQDRIQRTLATERAAVSEWAFQGKSDEVRAGLSQTAEQLQLNAGDDSPMMKQRMDAFTGQVNSARANNHITAQQAQSILRSTSTGFAKNYFDAQIMRDPEAVRDTMAGGQGVPTDTVKYLRQFGPNVRTEGVNIKFAQGLEGAIKEFKAEHPTEAVKIESLVRTTGEQADAYRRFQRGEISLAAPPGTSRHEQGRGEAADLGSGPFQEWLRKNPEVMRHYGLEFLPGNAGQIDPGHVQLRRGPGYQEHDNAMASLLDPQQKLALWHAANSMVTQNQAKGKAAFETSIADDMTAATRLGSLPQQSRGVDDFVEHYGEELGREKFEHYTRQLQTQMDIHNMASWTREEREALINGPSYGAIEGPGAFEQSQRQEQLLKANRVIENALAAEARPKEQEALRQFHERVKDQTAQFARTGKTDMSLQEFTSNLGEEKGKEAFRTFNREGQFGSDAQSMFTGDREFREGKLKAWEPVEGEPGYAEKAEMHDRLVKINDAIEQQHHAEEQRRSAAVAANEKLEAELKKDPASYVLKYSPAVSDAWEKLQHAQAPGQNIIDSQRAARDYAVISLGEQQRLGVPQQDLRLVPQEYADSLQKTIDKPVEAGGPDNVLARVKSQADLWGDSWPMVYRQMKGSAFLQVVGAGVRQGDAQRLASVNHMSFGEIVKDEDSEKATDITREVNKAMEPFKNSLAGDAGAIRTYTAFKSQVQKLAAVYVMQDNLSSADAAKKAAEGLINYKYEYRDSYRIPAKQNSNAVPFSPDEIQLGAGAAKARLGETINGTNLDIAPFSDNFGGAYTPEQLKAETANVARTGQWATNNDETGLWLVGANGQVVKRTDGSPLSLTWKQLVELGKSTNPPGYRGLPTPLTNDPNSAFGPRMTPEQIAENEKEATAQAAERERKIRTTQSDLAASRARLESNLAPGPARDAAMAAARERQEKASKEAQLKSLDEQEASIKNRPGRRAESRDRELARIESERRTLLGGAQPQRAFGMIPDDLSPMSERELREVGQKLQSLPKHHLFDEANNSRNVENRIDEDGLHKIIREGLQNDPQRMKQMLEDWLEKVKNAPSKSTDKMAIEAGYNNIEPSRMAKVTPKSKSKREVASR